LRRGLRHDRPPRADRPPPWRSLRSEVHEASPPVPPADGLPLGDERQRLDDADALLALGGDDRLGDGGDRPRRLRLGIALDERLARSACLAQGRIERNRSEQRDAELLRQALAAAVAERLAAHVLDDAE